MRVGATTANTGMLGLYFAINLQEEMFQQLEQKHDNFPQGNICLEAKDLNMTLLLAP